MLSYDQFQHGFRGRHWRRLKWISNSNWNDWRVEMRSSARWRKAAGQTTESLEESFHVTMGFQTRLCRLQESKGNEMIWPRALWVGTSDIVMSRSIGGSREVPSNGQVNLDMGRFCQDVNDGVVLGSFKSMIDGYHDVNPSFLRNGETFWGLIHGTYSVIGKCYGSQWLGFHLWAVWERCHQGNLRKPYVVWMERWKESRKLRDNAPKVMPGNQPWIDDETFRPFLKTQYGCFRK